jgi:hypothetical protein
VPIALVDLNELKDDNWDITAARVSQYINGVNHVRKIADLADADPALTRETLRHMLFYQVVMMVRRRRRLRGSLLPRLLFATPSRCDSLSL